MKTTKERKVNKNTLHKQNCQSKIRQEAIDVFGNSITLMGKYGFEYSIAKNTQSGITLMIFASRTEAIKEFNKIKAKKR